MCIGASRTRKSRRLSEHAVNFAPPDQGRPALDWARVNSIAEAMGHAAHGELFELQLGGAWNRWLNTINGTPERESAAYVERRRAARRKAFLDGPYYERMKAWGAEPLTPCRRHSLEPDGQSLSRPSAPPDGGGDRWRWSLCVGASADLSASPGGLAGGGGVAAAERR